MYARRVQITNYGPIERLDIRFPFEGATPKPVVLVGENGSGKSILLSYIVNGLLSAKNTCYTESPEVEVGKVYKIRSTSYIRPESDFYFGRIDFEEELHQGEMQLRLPKRDYSGNPAGPSGVDAESAWQDMARNESSHQDTTIRHPSGSKIGEIFSRNCVLYFPPNRFEEPAWLNEDNLKAKAEYMGSKHLIGYTSRKIINYSPLRDNQNWLFEVIYDRAAFEILTQHANFPVPVFLGYSGEATATYEIALQIVRSVMREDQNVRFGIGRRSNRAVSIMKDVEGNSVVLVPNIFQLSSGETSLLNLFLSILRDFDLCGALFTNTADIRGIVVVDEIDLHLHAVHQYEVLPKLIQMFPRVQFIVTTHSPLFVLGMKNLFGEDGFALYRLPQGRQISPEEFSEFESAYQSLTATSRFADDIRAAIENSQKPVVFVEGTTDQRYIQRAAELLDQQNLLERIELRDGKGGGNLRNTWKNFNSALAEVLPRKVILLHDCDGRVETGEKGNLFRRGIPQQPCHPLVKGIENLFDKATLERAREWKPAFIDIEGEHTKEERGEVTVVPETWTVNEDEKMNLCNWLCENGTADDFQHFGVIFDMLEEILGADPTLPTGEPV